MPQREALLLGEMIDAAEQAIQLARASDLTEIELDRTLRAALLWNFEVSAGHLQRNIGVATANAGVGFANDRS